MSEDYDDGDRAGYPPSEMETSGRRIESFSNMATEERQLDLLKIAGGYSPLPSMKNKGVYQMKIDCEQFSLASISATVRNNTILVTGTKTDQQNKDGNVSCDIITDIPCKMPENCDMEKVEVWISEDKILYISVPLKRETVVDQ